jgi:hypothetical protein
MLDKDDASKIPSVRDDRDYGCRASCDVSEAAAESAPISISGSIHGTVVDASGAVVSGIEIRLESASGSIAQQAVSYPTGQFDFRDVPRGSWVVVVPAVNGFAPGQARVLASGETVSVTVTLHPALAAQTVVAKDGQAASTESTTNMDAVAMSGDSLEQMPVFDQNYIATLTPFLDPASSASDGVTIMVNGIEMKASTVSQSAIAEVRINDDPYSAEFSRPGRGRLNIITKPGSSVLRGTLNFIARDAVFNAANYFAPVKPAEQRRIFEGDVTGPVGGGRHTDFVVSGDRQEDDIDAEVHAYGAAGLIASNVAAPTRNTQISATVSHDFSDSHRASIGYNFEEQNLTNGGVGGLVLPKAGIDSVSREDDMILTDRIIVSPTLFQQLQLTFEKDEDVAKSVTRASALQVQDSFIGGGAQADVSRSENTVHISDVVSWTHNRHYVRLGANIPQLSRRALDDHSNRLGTYSFPSLPDYLAGQPEAWTAQQGAGRGLYWINELGAFVQDEISLRANLRATVGVRYQWQTYITDNHNFAPRVSAAYSPNKRTVLRAGGGIFYDRTGVDFPATFKVHNGTVLHSVQVLNPEYPTPLPSGVSIASLPTSLVRTAPNMRTPYTIQDSVDVERQLQPGMTLTVGYAGIVGVSRFRSRDVNAPPPPDYMARPVPNLAFVQQIESGGRLLSYALEVTFRSKAGRWFTGQAKYTLGRADDNSGGINWYPQDQYAPNDEWARAEFDRLHRFNLLGNINPDHWLMLGVAATLYSDVPYTETVGSDRYQTGLGNARPLGVGRNTLEGGATTDIDLLWGHDFQVGRSSDKQTRVINLEASTFDVLNHPNFVTYVGNVRSPLFGQVATALSGRQMQFGLRYRF